MECNHDVLTRNGVCLICDEKVFDYKKIVNTETGRHVGYLRADRVPEM